MFTLEDIKEAMNFASNQFYNEQEEEEYIQSLSQKSWKIVGEWNDDKFKITKIL